jgi:hypothetical protein
LLTISNFYNFIKFLETNKLLPVPSSVPPKVSKDNKEAQAPTTPKPGYLDPFSTTYKKK